MATADAATGVLDYHRYLPYGAPRDGAPVNDKGFLHQTHDPTTNLIYLNNRHHDPTLGVFVSVDPLVTITGEPYTYGAANPITYSDASGLCATNSASAAECYEAMWRKSLPRTTVSDRPDSDSFSRMLANNDCLTVFWDCAESAQSAGVGAVVDATLTAVDAGLLSIDPDGAVSSTIPGTEPGWTWEREDRDLAIRLVIGPEPGSAWPVLDVGALGATAACFAGAVPACPVAAGLSAVGTGHQVVNAVQCHRGGSGDCGLQTVSAALSTVTGGGSLLASRSITAAVQAGRISVETATGLRVAYESMSRVVTTPLAYGGGPSLSADRAFLYWDFNYQVVR